MGQESRELTAPAQGSQRASVDRPGAAPALHIAPLSGPDGSAPAAPALTETYATPFAAPESDRELASLTRRQLELLGEDPDREGLQRTPDRVAGALRWMTLGYTQDVQRVVGDGVFEDAYDSMVLVRDVELFSLCEHHLLPFFGRAHVAYIPAGRILGLSKVARIIDVFARRLQVQERLTDQIAEAIMDVLQPRGVGVVIEARHMCMMMRGVEKQNSTTITSALRGVLHDDAAARDEFLKLAHR